MTGYDPAGPLPTGTLVLEASAGTGKTHAIAAMATRLLAEGVVTARTLAVITFTRSASGELRSRVRGRLRQTERLLLAVAGGQQLPPDADPTDRLLATGAATDLMRRLSRLRRALADLDAASIMTIHGFCQAMLDELGVLARVDPDAELGDDFGLALDQVTEDVYLRRYAHGRPPFDLATARMVAREATRRGQLPLWQGASAGESSDRVGFAHEVRRLFAERKQALGTFGFDDQLVRVRDALAGATGDTALRRLRTRWEVVLVDEFQDTDQVQWQILQQAFAGHSRLVLIGDPKQAIYGFRGADITTYTRAVAAADATRSLDRNFRCDAAVVRGLNVLFEGVELGEGIGVPAVTAVHTGRRLVGERVPAAVRLRCLAPVDPLPVARARARIDADLVAQVVELLASGSRVVTEDGERPLAAADIAVLVSSNRRGAAIAEALAAAEVPVAFSGAESVFGSTAAGGWLTLLRALEDPRRQTTRAAILTDFVGGDLAGLAAAGDEQVAAWGATLQSWSRILDRSGVAALFATIQSESGMVTRVLGRRFGARDLTDYRHLAELLHAQHSAGVRGQALIAWLTEAMATSDGGGDRTRRLETDRHAVQVLTVHKAKGLQFPIVLVPQAADLWVGADDGQPLVFHAEGEPVLDLGGSGAPGRAARYELAEQETAADRLRALYVAMTRAQSQLTLWWAPTKASTEASPLHRLLFRDRGTGGTPEPSYPVDAHPGSLPWLGDGGIVVEDCDGSGPPRLAGSAGVRPPTLVEPRWSREIDQLWTRTSYSGLTQAVHEHPPVMLTASAVLDDEPAGALADAPAGGPASPMAALPGGTGFGSLVHEVLEHLDWYTGDPVDPAALRRRLAEATAAGLERFPIDGVDAATLAEGMLPSLLTPLGRLTDGLALSQIPVRDRLSELDFEFALGEASTTTTLGDVAELLRRHIPAGHPLVAYPDALAQPVLSGQVLRGFLTGSIDSVLRIHAESGPRFVVVDYKTNRISAEEDLRLAHFAVPAMAQEMIRTHYPLQAILYCVALHRFLSGRLPGYRADVHLGGVGYLFVRGMAGPGTGEPQTGVFSWLPPAALVTELSDLLADRGVR